MSIYCIASEPPKKEPSGRNYIINKSVDYKVSVTTHLNDKILFIFFYSRTKAVEMLIFFSHLSYIALKSDTHLPKKLSYVFASLKALGK